MTVTASYDWDDLCRVIALTGDANHIHIPGSPMEWKHPYIPISEAAARSHGGGKIPKGWKAPSRGGRSTAGTAAAHATAARKLAADVRAAGMPTRTGEGHSYSPAELAAGHLDKAAAHFDAGRNAEGTAELLSAKRSLGSEAYAAQRAARSAAEDLAEVRQHGGIKPFHEPKAASTAKRAQASRALLDRGEALHKAAKNPGGGGEVTGEEPGRPNTIVQPDPVTGNLREMTQKETAEAASRYAQTLRPGSAERGEVERQALDIARGGPTWQRMKEDADALRPLLGTHGGGPKPEKDLSFFEVQDAYQAAHGRPAPKSMLTSWAFNGPSGQDKRSDWYRAGVKRKGEMQAQSSLRARLLDARPAEEKAKEDAAQASALADIKAVQQSGSRAAAAARAAAVKPKAPRAPRAPAPRKSAADKLTLISERMSGGDRTSGDMQAGDMLQGHQAISQAPAGIIGGASDPWWMAGPHGSFALSVKGGDGKRQLIPWGAEKQAEAAAAAVKAAGQSNRYGASYGSGFQRVLAKAVASRQHYEQLGFARSWDDLASVIELAALAPARAAARKATPGRPPGKPAGAVSPGRGSQGAASSAVPDPNGNPPASRRRGVTPLTPMRQAAAKSMRKLAAHVQESHPDMSVHDHLRDAARTLESGNEEASQRHLRAAMFALTPQSLMRNGLHTDDHHQGARQVMHGVHRHMLLVKDIADVGVKNREAVARLGAEDDTAPRPDRDPNNGYGPGALAQKPTARQPPGNQALNAPNRGSSGGSDPNVADPDGPQPRGSKQFAYGWDDLAILLAAGDDCYRCSTPNAPDARYCKRCGNPMEPRQPYDRFAEEDITCPFCGRGDERDAVFCDQCGKRLPESPVAAFASTTRAVDLSARTAMLERTPAPRGKPGGPGLYGVAGQEHEPYFQQVVKALIEKRGMPPSKAYAIAYGALRKWARGGGKVHGEVRAAAAGALAGEAVKVHGHAVTWDDLASVIDLSFNPAQARVAAGSATAGQFAPANGSTPPPSAQQPAGGKQPPKAPAQTPAQKAAAAHAAHVAHVAHLNGVSTAKAELLVTAQDDQQKADALIKQRDALTAALASAGGKTSKGQAGAKTASTAKTKSTAPATSGTAAAGTAKAGTTAASTSKTGTATAKTAAAKTASSAKSAATAVAAAAGSTAAIKSQIAQLNIQIGALLAAAAQATAQAAAMK